MWLGGRAVAAATTTWVAAVVVSAGGNTWNARDASNTCWGSGDCYHRSAERSTGPPNCVILQYHRPCYTHYPYAQTTRLALDNPVVVYASDSRASAARRSFYAYRYTYILQSILFSSIVKSHSWRLFYLATIIVVTDEKMAKFKN